MGVSGSLNGIELLRTIPVIDAETLLSCEGKEVLFRDGHGFLLYLSKESFSAPTEERLLRLVTREALVSLNEESQDRRSFWG